MESSFRLFRFRGIEIGANWSWVLIAAVLVWGWANGVFPNSYPGLSQTSYFVMAVVAVLAFFVTLVLHELGHALRALKEGMEIDGITLWVFGGVARFKGMFPSAGAEFRIAIAGPLVTLVIMVVFFGLTRLLTAVDAPAQVVGVIDWLALINAVLLGFNLVPALPLDGGRVLRAYLWHRQESFVTATESAGKAGRAFGAILIAVGILGLFTGAGLNGIFPALIGWFLMQAAQAEVAFAQFRQAMSGLRVRDLMTPKPETVRPGQSIFAFIEDVAHARGHSTYPVVERGRLKGLVSLRLAARVPTPEREAKTVADVMVAEAEVPKVSSDAAVFDAVSALQGGPGRAIVVDNGKVVGIVSGSDVARAIEMERIRGPREPGAKPARTPWIVWIIIVGLIVAAGGYLYTPPVAVIKPGKAIDVADGIEISGASAGKVNGEYLLTSVAVTQPNGLGFALALIRTDNIVPLSAVVPRDVDTGQFFEQQEQLFREARQIAAAAAARAAGLQVDIRGTGARVQGVVRGSPAAEVLEEGDVITAVDGAPVRLADDVGRVVRSRPSGTRFVLRIERGGEEMDVEVRSRAGVTIEGQPGIGIAIETRDFDIGLPFRIEFTEQDIGGPSAGITYALAVYDLLVPEDLARGRSIASTGVIDLDGRVGRIGGIEEKAIAADRAGAELFLVPSDEVEGARGSDIAVKGVGTLMEAIEVLKAQSN